MSKQQTIGPCYEREDKEDKHTDELIKTLNQTIMTKITTMIIMVMVVITKIKTTTKSTSKEMTDEDQTDNSQIGQDDKMDHITKEIDDQISKTIKIGND